MECLESDQFTSTKIDWCQTSVLKLIEYWEQNECLYNPKIPSYRNKQARRNALNAIANKIKPFVPGVTQTDIKTKINYLRSQYGREILKLQNSKKHGTEYQSSSYWFIPLSFLKDFLSVGKRKSSHSGAVDDTTSELESPPSPSKRENLQFVWPRNAVLQVIHLWRENECLYNPKHEQYYSKRYRDNVLDKMANALRKFYPEITSTDVKNKITYLRGQYDREISRIREKIGRMDGDVYEPSVFWYGEMKFLENFTDGKSLSEPNKQSTEKPDGTDDSLRKIIKCDESPFQHFKRARHDSCTPGLSRRMNHENTSLLSNSSAQMSYSNNNSHELNERNEAFCNYIKVELNEISNKSIKDKLTEKIMLAVFGAKKEQKLYNNDLEKCFEYV